MQDTPKQNVQAEEPPVSVKWADGTFSPGHGYLVNKPRGGVEVIDTKRAAELEKNPMSDAAHIGVILAPGGQNVWAEIQMVGGKRQTLTVETDHLDQYIMKRMMAQKTTSEPLMRELKIISENLKEQPRWLKAGSESRIISEPYFYSNLNLPMDPVTR